MPKSNLKLVSAQPSAPTLPELRGAQSDAKVALRKAEEAAMKAQRDVVARPPGVRDPLHDNYAEKSREVERARRDLAAATQAIEDYKLMETRSAGDDQRRRTLATAIEEHARAEAAAGAGRAALARARKMIDRADRAVEAAAVGVTKAKDENAKAAQKAATSGSAVADSGAMRQARASEQDAIDEAEAARAAAATIEAGIPELDAASAKAADGVTVAVNAVLAVPVPGLLARAIELQTKLGELRAVLRHLKNGLDPIDKKLVEEFFEASPFPHEFPHLFHLGDHPAIAAWRKAAEALARDAGVPLPASK
jgi:hypothetical protein